MSDSKQDSFESSDSTRKAGELRYARKLLLEEPVALERGGELQNVEVVYETYGRLNERRDNAVLICHALSGDSHVAAHDEQDDPGWWDIVVGPGKCIDTDRYFVICPNVLGGCRGTTGPNSFDPATGKPYGRDFPTITVADMVEVERRLVDHFGIERLLAVVGGSMGGHRALYWAIHLPDRLCGAVPIATSPRLTSQALAFDVVGRNAILRDPNFQDGQYYEHGEGPAIGLAMARMLGHITYLSREAMAEKFGRDRLRPRDVPTEFEKEFSVGSYLAYQGERFVERFDANSYLALSMAMDLFDLGRTAQDLQAAFAQSTCRWLILSFTSDWLFPPDQSREMVHALSSSGKQVSYCDVETPCGHDAFLLPNDLSVYGEMIRAFLDNLRPDRDEAPASEVVSLTPDGPPPNGRLDYDLIEEISGPTHSVLDLGCGEGDLLGRLKARGHRMVMGVELRELAILECLRGGLDVIQADLERGLLGFAAGQFDFVVLSRTLQVIHDVERVIDEVLRIGRQAFVSFPNFGHHRVRQMLCKEGHAPRTPQLHHAWYDSPNIRFFTIADFEEFCRERKILVHRRLMLDTESGKPVDDEPNLNADLALFVISRS